MKLPEDVRQILLRCFARNHAKWLTCQTDASLWPLEVSLGIPTQKAALQQLDGVRAWISAWQQWQGEGTLCWAERRWSHLGVQRLPKKLIVPGPEAVALWVGQSATWAQAAARYQKLTACWPALAEQLPKHFDALAHYSEADFQRLTQMLNWLVQHPQSYLYPRQIPLAGIDSKWLESRTGLITDLIAALQQELAGERDFFKCCGLRPPPYPVRMRVLDARIRAQLGGLGDISAPCDQLAQLAIRPKQVFIVENLQTGLAFEDLADSVVIMRLGYATDVLGELPWLQQARCLYWGDIDTHGFAILHRVRTLLPQVQSVLMDEATLIQHQALWVDEKNPHPAPPSDLPLLTPAERQLYQALKLNRPGQQVRLEQERINWQYAWAILRRQTDSIIDFAPPEP